MTIDQLRELSTSDLHERYERTAGVSAAVFAASNGADTAPMLEGELDRIEAVLAERGVL